MILRGNPMERESSSVLWVGEDGRLHWGNLGYLVTGIHRTFQKACYRLHPLRVGAEYITEWHLAKPA